MNLNQYMRCLKQQWWIVVLTAVLGLIAGAGSAMIMPKSYESQAQVFVNVANPRSVTDLQMGEQFAVARAGSYAKVATTNSVVQPVVDRLRLEDSPEELVKKDLVATNQPNTAMITITATSSSAQGAADLAQATAESLVSVSRGLETTPQSQDGMQPATVKLNVVQKAAVPQKQAGPPTVINTALGVLVGLVVGLLLVLLRGQRALDGRTTRRAHAGEHAAHEH